MGLPRYRYQQGNEIMRIPSQITELNGYLGTSIIIKSKSFSTKACHDRFGTYSRTSDMAPSISTDRYKTQTADWRLG